MNSLSFLYTSSLDKLEVVFSVGASSVEGVLVLLSSFLGLYGYMAGISVILMHILSLNSFGTDYTVSLRRINYESLKDTIIRAPWNSMKTRPLFNRNKIRMEEAKKCRK